MLMRLWQIFLLMLIPVIPGFTLLFYLRYTRRGITRSSIKYSIDDLPMGLAFYAEDGFVLLVNRAMSMLAETLTDAPLINGMTFYDRVFRGDVTGDARVSGNADTFSLMRGGTVTTFRRERIDLENGFVYQLSAYDTTDLYHKEVALRQEAEAIGRAQERLKSYDAEVEALAAREALLAAKTRIHDMLGQELLATRYYLTDYEADIDSDELLGRWERVMEDLRSGGTKQALTHVDEGSEMARNAMRAMSDAAAAMGLKLFFAGDFPEQSMKLTRLIVSCARVCMTNAVRHGDADAMTIRFEEKETAGGYITIVYENNGKIPAGDPVKGGGLEALELLVTQAEGTLSFDTRDRFRVKVRVPYS